MMQANRQTPGCRKRRRNSFTLLAGMTLLMGFQVCGARSETQASLTLTAQIVAERKIMTPGKLGRLFFDPATSRLLAECIQSQPYCLRLLDVSAPNAGRTRRRQRTASSAAPFGTIRAGAANGGREPVAVAISDDLVIVVACDFKQNALYWTSITLWGWGGYLHKTALFPPGGKIAWNAGEPQGDHLQLLAVGKQAGQTWQSYVRAGSDMASGGSSYTDRYQNGKMIKRAAPEQGFTPQQALYVSATDQLYLVYNWELCSLSGQAIPLPGRTPKQDSPISCIPVSILDADSTGQIAYYADTARKAIYKLRLQDGRLLATCRLPFAPTSLALDEKRKIIHVADGAGRRICQVRLF